ncbi:hypothetical protein ACFLZR_01765 [Candidatus Neomarinimicrobiota bacterium]
MYFLTLLALDAVIMYRQLALGQPVHEYEDLAIILTANVLVFISAVLYLGIINLRRIRWKPMVGIFVIMLILGSIAGIVFDRYSTNVEYFHYMFRVSWISLSLIALYAIVAYWGQRRLSRLSE